MSYMQRLCQGSSLRHAAAAWRAGATQLQAARVVMAASQRIGAVPAHMAAPKPVPSFSTSPSIPTSFAASGVQQPTGVAAAGTSSGAVEGSDSGEAGNSMSGASHTGSLSDGKTLRKRKRF
ncbi:hypothetical protein PLESTB_000780700 [Pleodorina starrii]|uniref:Uncharacterized protein n=1 Tax=Pleodorina starrii TaxID=330485 RepID=A0A9W6BK51_9CHLO|nr:hypothetical protein PLESTB_000780700 [Pleodorina starrii]